MSLSYSYIYRCKNSQQSRLHLLAPVAVMLDQVRGSYPTHLEWLEGKKEISSVGCSSRRCSPGRRARRLGNGGRLQLGWGSFGWLDNWFVWYCSRFSRNWLGFWNVYWLLHLRCTLSLNNPHFLCLAGSEIRSDTRKLRTITT